MSKHLQRDALNVGTDSTLTDPVDQGGTNFSDRVQALGSNGRACADCHMASDHFQLSPATVTARYNAHQACIAKHAGEDLTEWDDPLFRPIDADDFRTNGAAASDYTTLTQQGLVRITLPLPANMKLVDPATNAPSSETSVDVWRAVPSIFNVKLTGPDNGVAWGRGPNKQGGYQLDARVTTLQGQALGALVNHAQVQIGPTAEFLDDIAAFENTRFSSDGVASLSYAIDNGLDKPDPDGPLTDLEQQGKATFVRACAFCHGGDGLSTPNPTDPRPNLRRYADILISCGADPSPKPNFAGLTACPPAILKSRRTYEITLPDGTTIRRVSSDPGRALLTGFVGVGPAVADDWQKFDNNGLHGLLNTAPYFHDNSAATLEAVLDHYDAFYAFVVATRPPTGLPPLLSTDGVNIDRPPRPEERAGLLAYLQKL